ncbi:MAG: hypothetical protein ACRDA3_08815 [Peptostreptococcaceae bacterium]
MKRKKGFLLLESIVSLSLIVILVSLLYSLLFFCLNMKNNVEDKIELQQQALEITNYIEKVIGDSYGIINKDLNYNSKDLIPVISIKCRYRNGENIENTIKDKEISLKKDTKKLFINTLNKLGQSEQGGYEIGCYIDNLYIAVYENGRLAKIKLELSKNNQIYDTEFDLYIRNFEGDTI